MVATPWVQKPASAPAPLPAPEVIVRADGMTFDGAPLCASREDHHGFARECISGLSVLPPFIEAVKRWREAHPDPRGGRRLVRLRRPLRP